MRRLCVLFALVLGAASLPSDALAAGPAPSGRTLIQGAESRLDAWRAARARTRAARLEQAALARRIDALQAPGRGPAAGPLQALLRRSLEVEQRLDAALKAEANARAEVTASVRRGVRGVDREIRAAVPQLKTGPLASRKAAARHINQLRAARKSLRGVLAQLDARDGAAPRAAWARYEVAIEPLDGPGELEEKADFVEDTRDKLRRKRRALTRLLAEAKQEREIARAARDFDTYVRLFDEEARTDRVTRQGGGDATNLSADGPSIGGGAPAPNSGRDSSESASPDPAAPPADFNNVGNNSGGAGAGAGDGLTTDPVAGDDSGGNIRVEVPNTPTVDPGPAGPGVVRDIDADVLINLRVEELAAQGLDLATLERLVAELEALDGYLGTQSKTIRRRARDLEADEAKALEKK